MAIVKSEKYVWNSTTNDGIYTMIKPQQIIL